MGILGYFFSEALTSMGRSRGVSALAVGTIAIAIAMLGGFLCVSSNFEALVARWSREVQLDVYLRDEIAAEELERLREALRLDPAVEEVRHVSKEEALARFRDTFADLQDLPGFLGFNPLPASLEVRLAGGAREPARVRRLAESLAARPGVEDVSYDTAWVERLGAMIRLASGAGYFVGGILLLAATFTTSNVIRLALYSRRDEVEILRLVGATRAFIQGPFLVEGLVQGLLGGLLAVGLLAAAHLAVRAVPDAAGPLVRVATERFLGGGAVAALVAAGGAMGLSGSVLAVRKFLAAVG
jgi:cell division transport system permease protein